MTTKHLIPADGRIVRDPATRAALPPEGRAVELDIYWRRRLRDGDVAEQLVTLEQFVAAAEPKRSKKPKE